MITWKRFKGVESLLSTNQPVKVVHFTLMERIAKLEQKGQ